MLTVSLTTCPSTGRHANPANVRPMAANTARCAKLSLSPTASSGSDESLFNHNSSSSWWRLCGGLSCERHLSTPATHGQIDQTLALTAWQAPTEHNACCPSELLNSSPIRVMIRRSEKLKGRASELHDDAKWAMDRARSF